MAKAYIEGSTFGQVLEALDYGYDAVLLNDATYASVIEADEWMEE